ncbi:MAG: NADH-quinone oxidoreductase subunit NuoG [Gammaproteobacteria bacterium]|nr:NADH-quinone oxidoreductase subunit NuoG [Gammaproteobacteria bacterium]
MAHITIDGREFEIDDGDNLLAAMLAVGVDIPYFCWHPALGSAGACRQCAVKQYKDADDHKGRLVMACMTPVQDGARFSIEDAEAQAFRRSVIEWLMTNHPHDCPVCDEGGECHLQDMTVMTGHVYRRYRFHKRTHRNQDLGPFVAHEMNRCIACYRCVRFYRDYAGGTDLDAFATRNRVYFGRAQDGVLESPFAGNLVEVCPTGVFTDKTLARHYTRKWDLQSAPSLCVHCGTGCNTFVGERYGTVRRIGNRHHPEVNGWFLCDRGRFGYEHANAPERLTTPRLGRGDAQRRLAAEEALAAARGARLLGIGSPRASLEANHVLRTLVGAENFSPGFSAAELQLARQAVALLQAPPARRLSLAGLAQADAVVVLGEDMMQTAPRLALSLLQARRSAALAGADGLDIPRWQDVSVRDATPGVQSPLVVITPVPGMLDGAATQALRLAPREIAALTRATAKQLERPTAGSDGRAKELAALLGGARRPAVVTGIAQGSAEVLAAAAELARALAQRCPEAGFVCALPECNTLGAALFEGPSVEALLARLGEGGADTLVVVENDLTRRVGAAQLAEARAWAAQIVAIDMLAHDTTRLADVVLPTGSFAEDTGTLVNYEGRAQRRHAAMPPAGEARASWRWLTALGEVLGRSMALENLAAVTDHLAASLPVFAALRSSFNAAKQAIPRQSQRYSGRTAMSAHRSVFEPPPPRDGDSPLVFSMEGDQRAAPAGLEPRYWRPGWNSPQVGMFMQRELAGLKPSGDTGVLLFDGRAAVKMKLHATDNTPAEALLAVAVHHLFGSEELSARAPAVAMLAPAPYVVMNARVAAQYGCAEGDSAVVEVAGARHALPVRIDALADGVVGLPIGIGPLRGLSLPAPVRLEAT